MSHAAGQVRFEDGEVFHYEYNGTCDVVCTSLKRTSEEVERDWRSERNLAQCSCGRAEPVRIFTFYGAGYHWNGKACRHCMAITDGLYPCDGDYDEEDGKPDWVV